MSRILSLLVGIYAGLVVDQNFDVPRMPMPTTLVEQVKEFWDSLGSDENGKNGKKK